jgi:hypothetical protein
MHTKKIELFLKAKQLAKDNLLAIWGIQGIPLDNICILKFISLIGLQIKDTL